MFLPCHPVISVCLLAVHCGKPLVTWSHVNNEDTAQYNYPATVNMSCDEGYERVDGSYAVRCLANGQWNDTSLRCKRKWSAGVRYHSDRFWVFLGFFWTKSNSTTDSASSWKLFSFFTCQDEMSLTRGTCAWIPAGLQWQTHTPFKVAPKRLSDK